MTDHADSPREPNVPEPEPSNVPQPEDDEVKLPTKENHPPVKANQPHTG